MSTGINDPGHKINDPGYKINIPAKTRFVATIGDDGMQLPM
jgi:hypothetical protein